MEGVECVYMMEREDEGVECAHREMCVYGTVGVCVHVEREDVCIRKGWSVCARGEGECVYMKGWSACA